MGSLKTYPIPLTKPPVRPLPPPTPPTSNPDGTSSVPAQEPASAAVAGVFRLSHAGHSSQTYFGHTWDHKGELEKQKTLLRSNSHPHKGLTNRIINEDDLDLNDLEYSLVYSYELPPSFNLDDVSTHLTEVVDYHATLHHQEKLNRLMTTFWRAKLRQAFPRWTAHTIQDRELERFAAAVELQKVARIYVSKVRAERIRQYNYEQARLAAMAMMAPVLAKWTSRSWRGYKARQRVKFLEAKRRQMRLLIKVQTRLRMILARNRRRKQKMQAAEWRAAKLVQRNWRNRKGLNTGKTALERFGELKAIVEDLERKDAAATRIQNCYRAHVAWQRGPEAMERALQERYKQNAAATTIQARFRGRRGRRAAAIWKAHVAKQTFLGIHCQRITRGFLGRVHYYYERKRIRMLRANAATKLQAAWQGKIGRARARAAANEAMRHKM